MGRTIGRIIAIDGIDQSGKRTQTQLLAEALDARGTSTKVVSFPDYSTPMGRQLKAYLSGKSRLDYHAVHLLYAANKWEKANEIRHQINLGGSMVINRYTPSNLAYGVVHGLDVEWLYDLERDLPKADIIFILDVSPRTSFSRKKHFRDIHEGDLEYLRKVRSVYLRLAKRYKWKVVDAEQKTDTVHSMLWRDVAPLLNQSDHVCRSVNEDQELRV
jgi:dTMP kinase